MKDMIVTGGENVYPAEVESVLASFPDVVEVAVVGVPSEQWGETPMAFVVTGAAAPDASEVIKFSRDRLAHYKCPIADTLPEAWLRNPSGEVLKRELRAPY